MLPKMRGIKEIVALARKEDPETKLTENAVRSFCKKGELPCVQVGQKYLISVEEFGRFLSSHRLTSQSDVLNKVESRGLHPVEQ